MKKTIALLLAVICMTCIISTSYAAGSPDFQEATRLNDMQAKKQRGYRIVKFEYQVVSNAWYPPHFETTNSYVIDQIWTAIRKIRIKGNGSFYVTDAYCDIKFTFSDGTEYKITFTSRQPEINGKLYSLNYDSDFWALMDYYSHR